MKHQEDKRRSHKLSILCSASGLLLSVTCCIALIHVELTIQEYHRLMSNSVISCDQLETKILRKVQQNYRKWKDNKDQWWQTKGQLFEDSSYFERLPTSIISRCESKSQSNILQLNRKECSAHCSISLNLDGRLTVSYIMHLQLGIMVIVTCTAFTDMLNEALCG